MSELLRGLADAGRIVLVVTHSVLALEVCDFIVVMAEGRTVGELDGATASEEAVLRLATGQRERLGEVA